MTKDFTKFGRLNKSVVQTFEQIIKDLKNGIYKPVYFLMGEEPFYIDVIANYIAEHVLDEGQKEFNQSVLYGSDVDVQTIISEAKRFPMMGDYQVVIVKEAQNIKNLEPKKQDDANPLLAYVEKPQKSTLLVICYKYKKLDKRKALAKTIDKTGVLFESEKLKDYKVAEWIADYVKRKGYTIDARNANLLAEYLGNDLGKIVNETGKVFISLPKGAALTSDIIERNIGISKDYNIFELQKVFGERDVLKTTRIVNYFAQNQKEHPLPLIMATLYGYFTKLIKYHFLKATVPAGQLAAEMGVNPYFLKDYETAARNYNERKVRQIIGWLREMDVKSKGVDNPSTEHGDLLKEFFFKAMH
ncbi:MAG: DNA polymerase III subunit delta [Bacteroidia bacterium]